MSNGHVNIVHCRLPFYYQHTCTECSIAHLASGSSEGHFFWKQRRLTSCCFKHLWEKYQLPTASTSISQCCRDPKLYDISMLTPFSISFHDTPGYISTHIKHTLLKMPCLWYYCGLRSQRTLQKHACKRPERERIRADSTEVLHPPCV